MRKYYFISILFLSLTSQNFPQNYYPLEIGNRWDYFVHIDGGAMGETFDSLAIVIIEMQTLPNGLEYFVSSELIPWWNMFEWRFTKHIREENNAIYVFDLADSVDCFAFRFDIPRDSSYSNCIFEMQIVSIFPRFIFGYWDNTQHQYSSFQHYYFSKSFGLFEYTFLDIFVEGTYSLTGCIISGVTYGELLVSLENDVKFPHTYSLSQNYPNPFNPTTIIKYQIPELSFVTLKVYDVLGNKIAILINEEKPVGNYKVEWNGSNLPSGVYFYQLKSGNFIETKKMILIK